jgi:hypothetical protein
VPVRAPFALAWLAGWCRVRVVASRLGGGWAGGSAACGGGIPSGLAAGSWGRWVLGALGVGGRLLLGARSQVGRVLDHQPPTRLNCRDWGSALLMSAATARGMAGACALAV